VVQGAEQGATPDRAGISVLQSIPSLLPARLVSESFGPRDRPMKPWPGPAPPGIVPARPRGANEDGRVTKEKQP
jgi:hypothetical protein